MVLVLLFLVVLVLLFLVSSVIFFAFFIAPNFQSFQLSFIFFLAYNIDFFQLFGFNGCLPSFVLDT